MQWSNGTYRLDEVTRKFDLPCVICVTEGYYSPETDAESISAGDIIKIDKNITLHKVAANFASDCDTIDNKTLPGDDYVDLKEREILVPLNYNGKLKVKTDFKQFDNVLQLSKELPRYAKLRSNLVVVTEEGGNVELKSGQVIELDRIIPGDKNEVDKLVIQFEHRGSPLFASLPINSKGKFKTEPDNNEYTLKETIDRYKLPQVVSFTDDEIKRIYTSDLVEGIENMRTITETLRLNRLVSQNVLVGHYKPLEDAEADSDHFCQRTLVVLPLELTAIREIEVYVLQGATDEDYEEMFLIRNVSHGLEVVDGSLYVDFALKPGVKRFADEKEVTVKHKDEEQDPPPIPPRPRRPAKPATLKKTAAENVFHDDTHPYYKGSEAGVADEDSQDDDYIYPEPQPPPLAATSAGFSLADTNFDADVPEKKYKELKHSKSTLKHMVKCAAANIRTKLKSTSNDTKDNSNTTVSKPKQRTSDIHTSNREPYAFPPEPDNDEEEEYLYDYPDEKEIMALKKHDSLSTRQSPPTSTGNERPVAHVTPQSVVTKPAVTVKSFFDLNVSELEERLSVCGMLGLAKVCKQNRLDGNYMQHVSNDELQADPYKLSVFQVSKFCRVKNNWIPR